jgi:hypothetical protein
VFNPWLLDIRHPSSFIPHPSSLLSLSSFNTFLYLYYARRAMRKDKKSLRLVSEVLAPQGDATIFSHLSHRSKNDVFLRLTACATPFRALARNESCQRAASRERGRAEVRRGRERRAAGVCA